jgi:hypothetical protein
MVTLILSALETQLSIQRGGFQLATLRRLDIACYTVSLRPDTAGLHRGEFALVGGFKFHSVSLGGRLYPLPRRTTFRLRNVLHLMEARNRVAHVRGIFQRLLALLGKSELACGYPVTSCLGELCHCFPSSGVSPCVRAAPVLVTRQLLQLLQRGVVDVIFFSRGFSHARLIHFLLDPREKRLIGFLSWLVLMHACTMSRVLEHYRSIGNRADNWGIVFPAEQF